MQPMQNGFLIRRLFCDIVPILSQYSVSIPARKSRPHIPCCWMAPSYVIRRTPVNRLPLAPSENVYVWWIIDMLSSAIINFCDERSTRAGEMSVKMLIARNACVTLWLGYSTSFP